MKLNLKRLLAGVLTLTLLSGLMVSGVSAAARLNSDDLVTVRMILERPSVENENVKVPVAGAEIALYRIAGFGYINGEMVLSMRRDLWEHDYFFHGGRLRWTDIKVSDDYEKKMPVEYLMQDIEEMDMDDAMTVVTREDGFAKFEDLYCGLYLVVLLNPEEVQCTMRPFLATFPRMADGEYDLDGSKSMLRPKTEVANAVVQLEVRKVWKGDRESYYEDHPEERPEETTGETTAETTAGTTAAGETTAATVMAAGESTGAADETLFPSGTEETLFPSNTEETWPENVKPGKLLPRPDEIRVELWNGDKRSRVVILNKNNNWTYTFKDLPRAAEWRIQEQEVKGFKGEILPWEQVDEGHYIINIVNTADGTLVQTGELNWPVPILILVGAALMIAGFAVLQDKKKREA